MPRIDPLSLLKCLSVLLGPTGGIKSKEEVHRLANLMTKFSKKLVSKCIYIQILKTTNTDLLSQFMSAGGWNLIHMWLTDGILAKNWALIQELLELLLLCPVDVDRLKSNNCPKLIKGLSKEGSHQGVRVLASRLVEQWLKIVKGEAAPNSVPAQIMTIPVQGAGSLGQTLVAQVAQSQQQQQPQQQYSINCGIQPVSDGTEGATIHVQDLQFTSNSASTVAVAHIQPSQDTQQQQHLQDRLSGQSVQLQVVTKPQTVQVQQQSSQQSKKQSFVVVSTSSQSSVPVYKITIRDGKQVLAKVETDAANINSVLNAGSTNVDVNGDVNVDDISSEKQTGDTDSPELSDGVVSGQDAGANDATGIDGTDQVSCEVKNSVNESKDNTDTDDSLKSKDNKDPKDIVNSDSSKSSNKENRDSHKKDSDRKSSSDKKSSSHHSSSSSSKSSSKHSTSSSSHRTGSSSSHKSSSSHRSSSSSSKSSSSKDKSSRDKDKHHSSSSSSKHSSSSSSSSSKNKSDRDKEREKEKEKQKKDQAEKDKATLEKVQGQALSSKLGKIPKKKSEDEKSGDPVRKSSTDSRDSSKENKTDSKKGGTLPEKKSISISIESRKNSQDSTAARPKTVKTFNSKFRSTGLEEEVKPPPPRSAKKPNPIIDKKPIPQKLPSLKRPSPLREAVPSSDKRAKLSLDSPTTPPAEEKKGGIKLIPPKPKPMVLQESDMFMDALTASTKSKEPRKRKRRTSITKDGGPSEPKKPETSSTESRDVTPPPTSPTSADDKSPVVLKPNFKFYQDTLETEEDKEQKDKENSDEDSKRERGDSNDDQKDRDPDDDTGSNTPTPDDDADDMKNSDSPEDAGSDSNKKESFPEIRYVDGLRSVLLLQKRKGPKKSLKWKTDLESVRYFELDETERVNVTKTFTDMKQMEKQNEREAFQMARKLSNEDLMEERTRWKPLIPIDLPPALVEPGKDSREKDIQYAREKGILQALYFNRSMIPDSAAEPDEERHHVFNDPKIIPLDDLTGNKESEKDFTSMAWPEPKPQLQPQTPPVTSFHYPTFAHNQQPIMPPMGPQPTMGPMPQMPQQMMGPGGHMGQMGPDMGGPMPQGGGGWRTGDGKVVVPDGMGMNPMGNMPGGFPQGMEGGPMVPPGMMGPPPMFNQQQEGYGMMGPDEMGFNNMNNFQGPPGPMYGPGPNFQGPRGGGPMHRGRGGPGPGWYRGGGGPRGGWRGGGGWRGNGKQPPVCRQFSKNGYCRVGDKCQYLHPGVNCPPF